MKNIAIAMASLLLGSAAFAAESEDAGTSDLDRLLSDGRVSLSFRYRYEFVDQDGFDEDANASTLRTRLGLQSGKHRGFDFLLEVDDVRELYWDEFDAGGGNTPDRTQYPLVPDPKGTEMNQGYVNYSGFDGFGLKLGRQRINFDNQRFVGGVGWRQQEQTFDSFRADWGNERFALTYTYVDAVRRIFGEKVPAGKDEQDNTHFLNGGVTTPIGRLVGYYYHYDSADRPTVSSGSVGARLTGALPVGEDWKLRYEAEFASQSDLGDNPADYSAEYWHLDAGAQVGIFDFGIGWELLTGDEGTVLNEAFQTPLATGHAFNGWADVFLTTPGAGLDDKHVKFKATPGNWLIDARVHDFDAESGSESYGSEVDLQVGYQLTKRFRGDLFYADFNGNDGFGDVTKFWVMMSFAL